MHVYVYPENVPDFDTTVKSYSKVFSAQVRFQLGNCRLRVATRTVDMLKQPPCTQMKVCGGGEGGRAGKGGGGEGALASSCLKETM